MRAIGSPRLPVVARQLSLDCALAEVAHRLAQRGVRPLLIKGPVTVRWLYDDPGERAYADVDLLLAPDQFASARDALAELGFELQPAVGQGWWGAQLGTDGRPENSGFHEVWVRGGRLGDIVELHHTLALLSGSPALVWQRLSAGTSTMEIAGARLDVPSPAACAMIVALHAAQHGAAAAQPLSDLRRAVERVDVETWRAAAALAAELGGGPAFAVGLRLDAEGRELAERLGLSTGTRFIRLLASNPPATALGVERMLAARGARARLRVLARGLVPSPAYMRQMHPLARRGGRGLALAYLWRPVWLALRLPRGVHAWLMVTRAPRVNSDS